MGFESENTEIRTRFNLMRDPTIPVCWPNEPFSIPNPETIYCKFYIVNGDTKQVDIGTPSPTFRSVGIIYLSLFAPPDTGNGLVKTKADAMALIFRNWGGATVNCRAATLKDIGTDSSGWYQINIVIPFQRDEIIGV